MALTAGTRLGPYEIKSGLGAGGMGEVYKALDTRLGRLVAIKVLPEAFAADPAFRERFEREAQAVAALSHPHICALHDVGEQDGAAFLVMELLDGDTLAKRLEKGALPLDQALRYGIEIADALDKAHRAGIVHRDLKPGNIMLTKAGAKLLDFGLAKTGAPVVGGAGLSMLPTTPPNLTAHGTILGTFQYMAPEQLEGQEADARTDIFAFGAVLYEMLTGRKAFQGKSQASLIASIIGSEPPPISAAQPLTPPALDRVVAACLAKDPDRRWQNAADLSRELQWITGAGPGTSAPEGVVQPRKQVASRTRLAWIVAAVALVAAAAFALPAVRHLREGAPELLQTRFEIATPPVDDPSSLALSADGRQLAFVARAEGVQRLWVRPLDRATAQAFAGTDGASYPFWAPDGKTIGFFADGKLKRIDLAGGAPQVLTDAPYGRGGTWNQDGIIVFMPANGVLMRVAATGGTPTPVTRFAPGQESHRWPQFLPDGRRFLFFAALGRPDTRGVYIGTLDGDEPTRVLASESGAMFAPPGALLLVRQGVLTALRFDPARGVVSGDPSPVAQGVGEPAVLRGAFTVSATGVLAHRAGGTQRRQLVWMDRAGTVRGTVGPPDETGISSPELAPDGQRVAVFRSVQANQDVWLIDVGRGVPTRFTFDASSDESPLWSPDGRRLVFRSTRNGSAGDLFEKLATRAGDERPLLMTPENKTPLAWSPDGRVLLYSTQGAATASDLWVLPLEGDRKPSPFVRTPFDEAAGQFSPDGRWVAYQSNESGRTEIYVRPFPGPGGASLVSTTGGSQPRWRPDGKELFYVAPDSRLMAGPITVGADHQTWQQGAPVPLFVARLASGANIGGATAPVRAQYTVAPDGRFLLNAAVDESSPPITVVLNWDAGLFRK